jgi:hypothetical protein
MRIQPLSRIDEGALVNERVNSVITAVNRFEEDQFIPTYAADTGSSTAYAIAPVPGIKNYVVGQMFTFKAANANTSTTPTLAVNGLTAGTIKWADGTALAVGDIAANGFYEVTVGATTPVFYLQNGLSSAAVNAVGVRQVVSTITGAVATGTTLIPLDNTIPQSTEGDQYMTLAITPKSATSNLVIDVVFNGSINTTADLTVALFQDSTANALAAATSYLDTAFGRINIGFRHLMTSGTTSATTFKVRAGSDNPGTLTFNGTNSTQVFGGVMSSSISIMEVGA